jgi:hypothetical protein
MRNALIQRTIDVPYFYDETSGPEASFLVPSLNHAPFEYTAALAGELNYGKNILGRISRTFAIVL